MAAGATERSLPRGGARRLRSQGERVLRVPPIEESDAVHGVQHDLHALLIAQLPTAVDRRVLEHQSHSVMPHVRAHIDRKLEGEKHIQ